MASSAGVHWGAVPALVVFYAAIFALAAVASRRRASSATDLMLAGRQLPLGLAAATMAATWVGGGYINGSAETAYASGLVWVQAPWGYALSLVVGGLFYAPIMRRMEFTTMLDPLQQRFGNRLGSVLYLPAFTGEVFWSAAILTALGSTFGVVFGVDVQLGIIVSAAVAIGYTLIGGLWAVAVTDVVQLLVLVVGLAVATPLVASHLGGMDAAWAAYTAHFGEAARLLPPADGWRRPEWSGSFWSWWDSALLLVFGGIPWHVYFQRVLASRDASTARWLSLLAAPVCILAAIPAVLIGAVATVADWSALGLAAPEANLVLPWVLRYLGGPLVASVGLAAIAAAVMSSVDSSILSAASMGAWNIYQPLINPRATANQLRRAIRGGIAIVGATALLLALRVQSVYGLWFLSSDFVYCVLFPQLTAALFDPKATRRGAKAALVVTVLLRLGAGEPALGLPRLLPYPMIDAATGVSMFPFRTFTMLCGLVTLMVVSRLWPGGEVTPLTVSARETD
ncbi:MAG: sodium:solute symporter [Acidobacteria bacterium]|nr:sodium:solute symporter [Acidobacteriota bacterium]